MPLPIEETIAELGNRNKPLLNSRLTELSSLSLEEIEFFKDSWSAIEPERRRHIVHRLVQLAEDNLELNVDTICQYCLRAQDDRVRSIASKGVR